MPGRFRLGHAALLLVPALAVVMVVVLGRRARDDEKATLAALRESSGPRLPSVARSKASRSTEPARYDRDSLYELIDGAAESYLARGFESCLSATYTYAGPPEVEVAVEVHRFGDEGGARTLLAAERPGAAMPCPGLEEAVSDGSVLLMTRGRDLLKATLLSLEPSGRNALTALATAWANEAR